MKPAIYIFILIFISSSIASSINYHELLKIIKREEAMLKGSNKNNISLRYRHFELMSEKLKITKHFENLNFISQKQKTKNINRKIVFTKTLSLYRKTQKLGLSILKASPNSRYAPSIYLTLAQNSKQYAYDKKSTKYLKLTISKSKKKSHLWYMATVLLAEEYYNQKKYKVASRLFKSVIYNNKDEWHTKNLFNYGWCLFKTHNFDQAINNLEESYKLSSDKKYIDLREQLESSMAVFYTLGKQVSRGIEFISSYNKMPFEAYFKLLKQASSKGLFNQSSQVISILKSESQYIKEPQKQIELALFLFDHYKQYKKDQKLYTVAMSLKRFKLNRNQSEEATYKIKDQVKSYQIMLKASYKKHDQSETEKVLNRTLDFFNLLSFVDKSNSQEYDFFSAESLFSVEKYNESIRFYKKVLNRNDIGSDNSFVIKSMDAIYAAIENSKLIIEDKKSILEYAFLKNIDRYPKKNKTLGVYDKLFNLYLANSSDKNMMKVIFMLKTHWPNKKEQQLKLFKITLDFAIQNKNVRLLADKIKMIKTSTFSFKFDQLKKTELILSTILFNKNLKHERDGDYKKAISGYKSIFFNKNYPDSTRQKSALKLAEVYNNRSKDEEVLKWIIKSNNQSIKTQINMHNRYHSIAQKMALKQNFTSAANINRFIIKNNCKDTKNNNIRLLEAISFDLTNHYYRKALFSYNSLKRCTNDTVDLQAKIIDYLFLNEKIDEYVNFISKKEIAQSLSNQITQQLNSLYWKYSFLPDSTSSIRKLAKALVDKDQGHQIKLQKNFLNLKNRSEFFTKNLVLIDENFTPEIFNTELEKRFSEMASLIKKANPLLGSKNIDIILGTYALFDNILNSLSKEVLSYNPTVMPIEFTKGFKKQMREISKNLLAQRNKYVRLKEEVSYKNKYLSPLYISQIKSQEYISYDL